MELIVYSLEHQVFLLFYTSNVHHMTNSVIVNSFALETSRLFMGLVSTKISLNYNLKRLDHASWQMTTLHLRGSLGGQVLGASLGDQHWGQEL